MFLFSLFLFGFCFMRFHLDNLNFIKSTHFCTVIELFKISGTNLCWNEQDKWVVCRFFWITTLVHQTLFSHSLFDSVFLMLANLFSLAHFIRLFSFSLFLIASIFIVWHRFCFIYIFKCLNVEMTTKRESVYISIDTTSCKSI